MRLSGRIPGPLLLGTAALGAFMGCPADAPEPPKQRPAGELDLSGELAERRDAMVRFQIQARGLRDEHVLRAMRKVPRHEFVPTELREEAYGDYPLPIGLGQTISQPYIVALMTEAARLKPGARVLEIGTGSGYQAAILAEIASEVYTIELLPALAVSAASRLKALGYANVTVRTGDGYAGWPEKAPFDAILVTCGAPEVPPPLIEQLATGGRLIMPVGPGDGVQSLLCLEKRSDGNIERSDLGAVRFVPLRRGEPK